MGTTLSGKTPATTFDALIKVGDNSALSASLKTISDGVGNDSPLKLSTSAVGIGSITNVETEINSKQATLVSGSSIKTINSNSLLGSGDVSVQDTLVSGTNIKTINSSSLLGSGDISVQSTLVSGTSIKTINSTSVLGSGDISVQATLVSGTNIKSINSTSLLGSGDLSVQETLISGTNVKTINSTSLLGSGDVAVQETLVSGTNIKTINSTSLLGSGDISVSASPAGSDTQIQFNDSGSLGADSLFNWDNTNKRLGVGETTPTARVHIKGEGATSATTSLLVQNSAGTDLFEVADNGNLNVSSNNFISKTLGGNNVFQVSSGGGGVLDVNPSQRNNVKFRVRGDNDVFLLQSNPAGDNVGIGASSPDASAKLQIDSTTQGFLPPRMTTTQVEAIEPTAGLIVYDTTTNNLKCYDGSAWNNLF